MQLISFARRGFILKIVDACLLFGFHLKTIRTWQFKYSTTEGAAISSIKMAAADPVLLKSTLEISNKAFKVSLTASEIHWEAISTVIASGPYSEPLVSK